MVDIRVETATKFFHDLEQGKGKEVIANYLASPDAFFTCQVIPLKTMIEYAEFMKTIYLMLPDFKYDIYSVTSNDKQVVFCATMTASHSGQVGPVPASDPPKKTFCHYVYVVEIGSDAKITGMTKVFDIHSGFSQLGWPLPQVSN